MSGNAIDTIFAVVDSAAAELLKQLDEVQLNAEGKVVPITFIERIKAFEAVVAYAAIRAKVEPPEKKMERSRFDELHTKFHGSAADGDAPERRTRGRKAANGADAGHA